MIKFAGLNLRNPFVVASSPLTAKPQLLQKAEEFGAAAASVKLTFIKQPFLGKCRMYNNPKEGSIVCHDRRLDLEEGQRVISEARKLTKDLILFSNITHAAEDLDGWAYLAKTMQDAGAHAIEANMICPNLSMTAKRLGQEGPSGGGTAGQHPEMAAAITRALKESVSIPVIVKLTPNVTDITEIAKACEDGGADGVCMAGGQLSLPPMDIYHPEEIYPLLEGASLGSLGGPASRLLGFAMVASAFRRISIPIIGGGGLEKWEHAVQYMMWGSTLVTACTVIMWRGFEVIPKIIEKLDQFIQKQGYSEYKDLVGQSAHTLRAAEHLSTIAGAPTVDPQRCNGCGVCLKPGHCEAIYLKDGLASVWAEKCMGCSICIALCPRKALAFKPLVRA
jgi:dihydroorotate dehydrogenase subfamily 1